MLYLLLWPLSALFNLGSILEALYMLTPHSNVMPYTIYSTKSIDESD